MYFLLVLLVAASRFLPHPPNVACVGALGLFAGCYLSGRLAWIMPVAALFASDVVGHFFRVPGMGFYSPVAMAGVYVAVLGSVPIGRWLSRRRGWVGVPAGSLAASTLFFLVSNFGVWLAGWYPMTTGGLLACFTNAIPFFGYTVAGDLLYTTVLFGVWEASRRTARSGRPLAAVAA
jgi:hypothetical protein